MIKAMILLLTLLLPVHSLADPWHNPASSTRDPFARPAPAIMATAQSIPLIENKMLGITQSTAHSNKLSLTFNAIPVAELLQLLAQYKGVNLVLSDAVTGNITLHLDQVSWEQALDTVLLMQNLAKHWQGSILFIAPLADAQVFNQQQLQAQHLISAFIPTHYAKATDLAVLLQDKNNSLLSARGTVVADARTNTLWLHDTPQNLNQIRSFLRDIDIPAKQVSITARIMNVDESSVEDLGLQFGTVQESNGTAASGQLHMDTPFSIEDSGHVTIAIARLRNNTVLDLELSALAREGHAQMISSPQLVATNQEPALIESGQEIPYQEKTASGATNTAFKKAVLSLKVTPEITPDNKILLHLAVNQDKVSTLSVDGMPAISTQEIQTQVLVANGETLVLGGIYEQSNSQAVERIPFWSSVPILGTLFSHKRTDSERKELLIFVTPSIVAAS